MDYAARSEDSAAQLADLEFPGKWVADLSEMGDEYADVDLYSGQRRRDLNSSCFGQEKDQPLSDWFWQDQRTL